MLKNIIRYRIKFTNFDQKILNHNLLTILFELKKHLNFVKKTSNAQLPSNSKTFCVLRSPFVDNISKEHYELKTFKNVLVLEFLNPQNILLEKLIDSTITSVLWSQESKVAYKKIKISY